MTNVRALVGELEAARQAIIDRVLHDHIRVEGSEMTRLVDRLSEAREAIDDAPSYYLEADGTPARLLATASEVQGAVREANRLAAAEQASDEEIENARRDALLKALERWPEVDPEAGSE